MNWITNYVRPRINSMLGRRPEVPENLWIKCPETGEMVFHKDLEDNKWVIPASGYHMKMPAKARLVDLFDGGVYEALPQPKVAQDPLKFRDSKKYTDRLRDSRTKTEQEDTILAGVGLLKGLKIVAVVHEFQFMGALWALLPAKPSSRHSSAPFPSVARSSCSRPPVGPACRKAFFR